jgi:hypothetical protein
MRPWDWLCYASLWLATGGQDVENPWKGRVAAAVAAAESKGTPAAYRDALDVVWRADDWKAGLTLARQALDKHPADPSLPAVVARALWRGGQLLEAERIAERINVRGDDRIGLTTLIEINVARGELVRAAAAADRLETLGPQTAEQWFHIISLRQLLDRNDGLDAMVRRARELAKVENGYPETLLLEMVDGLAEFLAAVGPASLNQVLEEGSAAMTQMPLIGLPACNVLINGRGPFRMIVDTGGSVMLSVDNEVADDIGLKSIATAAIRGVAGKDTSGQALVDELRIDGITCRRVMTRIFGVRQATAYSADGIIGTGMFAHSRLTLDFADGRMVVSASSDRPGPGTAIEARIVSDAKLIALSEINGRSAVALLDSGADLAALSPSRCRALFPDQPVRSLRAAGMGVGQGEQPQFALTRGITWSVSGRCYENFGGVALDVLDDVLSPFLGVQVDILVGMPVFRDMKSLTIDFPRCRLWAAWIDAAGR